MKKGFTVCEILIVLGLIGIVAELVLPQLVADVQNNVYKASYKSAYSKVQFALSKAISDDALHPTYEIDAETDDRLKLEKTTLYILSEYFKVQKKCYMDFDTGDVGDMNECWNLTGEVFQGGYPTSAYPIKFAFIDASGNAWALFYETLSGSQKGRFIGVDTNASKGPNRYGKDRFAFGLCDNNQKGDTTVTATSKQSPVRVMPLNDNSLKVCFGANVDTGVYNKCKTTADYYGTSWLYN